MMRKKQVIFMLSEEPSKPLRGAGITPSKRSNHSRGAAKGNLEAGPNSRKRRCSVTGTDDIVSKKLCEDSEFSNSLQDKPGQDESGSIFQAKQYIPHHLIGFMYRLDLAVLYSLRKSMYENRYSSLSLAFEDSAIDKFSNIVLRYEKKSVHVQIENVDKYYTSNEITYARLFNKERRSSSINSYFGSFVKHLIYKSDSLSDNVENFVIYTKSSLDLTEDMKFKKGRLRNFYPFKFDSINIQKCDFLKDFLFTNNNTQGSGFYQFSRDKTTREELLNRLEFSSPMQKIIKKRNLSQEFEREIKVAFLDKLIFAINQPNREKLNSIVKSEIENNSEVQDDYISLQQNVLRDLTAPEKHKKLGDYISEITYEFNLLLFFLHPMFLHRNMFSVNFEGTCYGMSHNIVINYKDRFTYVKAHTANSSIGYSQLFPFKQEKKKNTFSINKYFTLFVEELEKDIRYFIIYTNVSLDLTEEKGLRKRKKSEDFYPLKFNSIDIRKKKYKILRDCACMNETGLYQFAQEETTREKLSSLLKLPSSLQKEKEEGKLSNEKEKEMKEKFLHKLIFAVNQPNEAILNAVIRDKIEQDNESNKVPYNYEELHEIALRWSESHEFGPITKGIMEKLLEDIKNNRSSYQEIQNQGINEEIKFAKNVVDKEETPAFNKFLDFLIKGEGRKYLKVLKRKGIKLTSMSSILDRARTNATKVFKDLYDLWFDEKGNKTQYLKILEGEGINLSIVSSILSRAGANAANAFKDLYDLWFDEKGHKTQYLKTLEEEGVNLSRISSILSRAGANATKAFKDLYDLWFDEKGNKTQYLKTLEEEGINLSSVSGILSKAGANAARAFKNLYDLWFDEKGNKTQYLKALEEEGINLANMSSILNGAGDNAAKACKDLHDLWFDEKGNKTQYLKTLEEEGMNLSNMSGILSKAGANAAKAFKDLYDLWFDEKGNKTQYLKTLEQEGMNLSNMSGILNGVGTNAAKAFKDLYDLWFDAKGNKTQYLKALEGKGINLTNMSSILHGVGANAAKAFKDLYNLWFDKQEDKTQYLKTLEEEEINLADISSILNGAGTKAPKAFKELYDLWFDAEGNKTHCLKTLKEKKINLTNMSSILDRAGANAAKAFKDLYDLWFDEQGNKTQYLKTLKEEGINISNISSILNGAGPNSAQAFRELYNTFFNEQGNKTPYLENLEEEGITLTDMSSFLSGTGANAAKTFKDLYDLWFDKNGNIKRHLKHFIKKKNSDKCFTIHNLSNMLSAAGANAKVAFEKLHSVCFNNKGKRTRLLNDFYNADFEPSNLSSILCGAGIRAASILKRLHSVCFDDEGERTKLLDDFCNVGFRPGDLCNILSGVADHLEKFHDFCFIGETKNYLNDFVNEKKGFTLSNLSQILHGANTNIYSALIDFHDVCFDETGNETQFLNDFYKVGFKPSNLSNILSMAGNNAAFIFRYFHKSCFNKDNYLNHFLAKKKLFTPKTLSKILDKIGLNICHSFEKLHDLCFDKAGNKTNYLNNLIKDHPSNKILDILHKKVRKAPAIFLDDKLLRQKNFTRIGKNKIRKYQL